MDSDSSEDVFRASRNQESELDFSDNDFSTLSRPVADLPLDNVPTPEDGLAAMNIGTQSLGLSDPILSVARRRQLDAINRLLNLGAQLDVDIPQIVVIGSQSAGKSSLIESISGITLPRSSGTCTWCPTECRLVHSNTQWQCTVSLRFMTDESNRPLDQVRNVPFGQPITDLRDVEERLRRAQRAVLNPGVKPQHFLEDDHWSPGNELEFATNCVSVEIKGPDVTDLSFCDLPGLIASVSDGGRDEDVENVKQLISSYISKPSCIILLTVACETDFETQGAYRLAKQYDRHGTRTIGVLTKPDRIPDGEEGPWVRLIKNESSALENGWYCVKQPSMRELEEGLTFQEARRRDEEYFTKKPWSILEPRHRKHLGARAVTQKLNKFLMSMISKRFPEIMQELQRMLQQTKKDLQKLPTPVSNDPVLEVMHLVGDFSDDLVRHAEGFNPHASTKISGLAVELNQFEPITNAHEAFRRQIRATAPDFRSFNNPDMHHITTRVSFPEPEPSLDWDHAVLAEPVTYYPRPASPESIPATLRAPSPARTCNESIEYFPEPRFLLSKEADRAQLSLEPIYLNDVVDRVHKATSRELPGYYPFHVLQDLVTRSTDEWEEPALCLIDAIHSTVVDHQTTLMKKYFGKYAEGGLRQAVSNLLQEYMQRRRQDCMARIMWLLELEAHAFTLNKHYQEDYRNNFLEFYRKQQREHLGRFVHNATAEPWNSDQFAIEIMASVRAYFQVAYERVVDMIPLAIDRELVRVHKRSIQDALFVGLKVTGPDGHDHCQRLLAEPAEVVARREELRNRLVRLEAAQRELSDV